MALIDLTAGFIARSVKIEADQSQNWAAFASGAGDQAVCGGADLMALSRGERLAPEDEAQRAWGAGAQPSLARLAKCQSAVPNSPSICVARLK